MPEPSTRTKEITKVTSPITGYLRFVVKTVGVAVGKAIQQGRQAKGLTQKDLAQVLALPSQPNQSNRKFKKSHK